MMGAQSIIVNSVSKRYWRQSERTRATTLKSYLLSDLWRGRGSNKATVSNETWALKDVSFALNYGQTTGIIGSNGSGKSTLLKLLARICRPDVGSIHLDGRVAALIELGAGFHPELTGRENIIINGVILGMSKAQMRERMASIIEFSGLKDFIRDPVRTYSSGMYARLGFAVAIHVSPDILLIDEILSVGDAAFTAKCHAALTTFRRQKKSIVLVSHDLGTVQSWCDQVLWLDKGHVRAFGPAAEVVGAYQQDVCDHVAAR